MSWIAPSVPASKLHHRREFSPSPSKRPTANILAGRTLWHVLAIASLLPTREIHPLPRPPTAADAAPTEDIHILGTRSDSARDTLNREIGDGNAGARVTGRASVLVVLLDDDAVVGYVGELDVAVGDAFDGAGGAVDGFDAEAWVVGSWSLAARSRDADVK